MNKYIIDNFTSEESEYKYKLELLNIIDPLSYEIIYVYDYNVSNFITNFGSPCDMTYDRSINLTMFGFFIKKICY